MDIKGNNFTESEVPPLLLKCHDSWQMLKGRYDPRTGVVCPQSGFRQCATHPWKTPSSPPSSLYTTAADRWNELRLLHLVKTAVITWLVWVRFKQLAEDSSFPRMNDFFLFLTFFPIHTSPLCILSKGLLCAEASWVKLTTVCLWGTCRRGAVWEHWEWQRRYCNYISFLPDAHVQRRKTKVYELQ